MQGYLSQVKCLQSEFDSFDLLHIPRNGNAYADSLAMLETFSTHNLPRVILVEDLYKPTETRKETAQIHQIRKGSSWMDSIIKFLREDTLPKERIKADKVKRKATRFRFIRESEVIQAFFFKTIFVMYSP